MANKTSHFAFDWWIIQKRFVYLVIAIFMLCGLAAGAAVYVWKYGNPLKNVAERNNPAGRGSFRLRATCASSALPPAKRFPPAATPSFTPATQCKHRPTDAPASAWPMVRPSLVKPNSTIIVRDNARADDGKKTNVHVVVDSGQMSVRTEQQADGTTNVVETPQTKNQMGEKTNASFGVNPEGTEEIRVNTGVIETTNHAGDKTSIHGGEYVSVNNSGGYLRRKDFGRSPAFRTTRSRKSSCRRQRCCERGFEMAAPTVWRSCLLSS